MKYLFRRYIRNTVFLQAVVGSALAAQGASALADMTIYKCTYANGRIEFTDVALSGKWQCTAGEITVKDEVKPGFHCISEKGVKRESVDDMSGAFACKPLDLPAVKAAPRSSSPGALRIGMSKEDVIKAWGQPKGHLSKTISRAGVMEKIRYPSATLTFLNGSLELIQN